MIKLLGPRYVVDICILNMRKSLDDFYSTTNEKAVTMYSAADKSIDMSFQVR